MIFAMSSLRSGFVVTSLEKFVFASHLRKPKIRNKACDFPKPITSQTLLNTKCILLEKLPWETHCISTKKSYHLISLEVIKEFAFSHESALNHSNLGNINDQFYAQLSVRTVLKVYVLVGLEQTSFDINSLVINLPWAIAG